MKTKKWNTATMKKLAMAEGVALDWLRKEGSWGPVSDNALKSFIVSIAVQNPKRLSNSISGFLNYCQNEGFNKGSQITELLASRIIQQPEYKSIRRKMGRGV